MSNVSMIDGHIDREERKLTDKEIIKSGECCFIEGKCSGCVFADGSCKGSCTNEIGKLLLDLVNRQQAEIEEMHKRIVYLDEDREGWSRTATTQRLKNIELQAEIERLKLDNEVLGAELGRYGELCPKIKAEAIKEFMEKLKDLSCGSDLYDRDERWVQAVTVEEIDETYKEMGLE